MEKYSEWVIFLLIDVVGNVMECSEEIKISIDKEIYGTENILIIYYGLSNWAQYC